jgi:hypothetical protein
MEAMVDNPQIRINADGVWYYGETALERITLVRLFYSVLKLESDQYYLVTPVEKIPVVVEDVPYAVIGVEFVGSTIQCTLNDETIIPFVGMCYPRIGINNALYIRLNSSFEARFTRSAFAQISNWIEQENESKYFIAIDGEKIYFTVGDE